MRVCMREKEKTEVLELSYQGYLVGWIDHASALEFTDHDDLYINAAILSRLAA
jgi:hypothetical protein